MPGQRPSLAFAWKVADHRQLTLSGDYTFLTDRVGILSVMIP
jgi:hypothetical protein